MRICKEDRRIEEDRVAKVKLVEELRVCSNREPGRVVEQWVCGQRVYTRGVSKHAIQGETEQERGAVEPRQEGVTTRTLLEEPATETLGTQAQLKIPIVKKEKAQGAHQASRGEATKTRVGKITAARGARHPQVKLYRTKREGDDIKSLMLDRASTRAAQARRPAKVTKS